MSKSATKEPEWTQMRRVYFGIEAHETTHSAWFAIRWHVTEHYGNEVRERIEDGEPFYVDAQSANVAFAFRVYCDAEEQLRRHIEQAKKPRHE